MQVSLCRSLSICRRRLGIMGCTTENRLWYLVMALEG